MTFQDITHPDDLETDLEFVRQMLAGDIETYQMDKRYIRKDGLPVWITLTVALVQDKAGTPKYFISIVQDINERKEYEKSQKKRKLRLWNLSTRRCWAGKAAS